MKNFGKIKNVFNNILGEAIANKDVSKKKLFNKYVNNLKEDEILKKQFDVYTYVETLIEENQFKASEKIKLNLDTLSEIKRDDIIESNNRLLSLLGDVKLDSKYDNEEIHESISNLIFSKDINDYVDYLNEVIDYVKSNKPKKIFESTEIPNSILTSIVVDKFNGKYGSLDESSKELIKLMFNGSEKEKINLFETSVKDCLNLINAKLSDDGGDIEDLEVKEGLMSAKENLLLREYKKDTFEKDMVKIINLKNDLN
tara:strand:- start:2067 stop:2834 length:768 start_codon:yes stop_codon:yes gene_type:complete